MIERNLGNAERIVRLVLGIVILSWLYGQNGMNQMDWFVGLVAVALVLNGIFSRCYLWFLLELDTCQGNEECRSTSPTCP